MNYLSEKKNDLLIHLVFLFILSLYYLIPYFLVGQLILSPHRSIRLRNGCKPHYWKNFKWRF